MRKKIVAGVLSCFIALLAAGAVSLVASDLSNRNAPSNGLPDIICDAEWAPLARQSLETRKPETAERVLSVAPSFVVHYGSFHAVSHGIPASSGQDLITFIRLRTTCKQFLLFFISRSNA